MCEHIVVSTVGSGTRFARFSTVEYVTFIVLRQTFLLTVLKLALTSVVKHVFYLFQRK